MPMRTAEARPPATEGSNREDRDARGSDREPAEREQSRASAPRASSCPPRSRETAEMANTTNPITPAAPGGDASLERTR